MMRAGRSTRLAKHTVGDAVHNFKCVELRNVEELNLVGYKYVHNKTNAVYYHYDTPDRNNAFCIGFRTPAPNDKGTTHVLEHTVLCGSRKYPVRDPFFTMHNGRTLANFMNAMTGADYTLYPFATANKVDFANLLDVYLDAVLHPLLRLEDFNQEGHRLQLVKDEATGEEKREVEFNGVVFNEMKGVMSDPQRHFAQKLYANTLPGTHYEYLSGGFPPKILDLTHEELVQYHHRHYHPSNSVSMTYGSENQEAHMKHLDEYFSAFEPLEPVVIPQLKKYHRSKTTLHTTGPLDLYGNPEAQVAVTIAAAIPEELDTAEGLVKLEALSDLLSSGPSSPLYKALIEPQIGTKYAAGSGYSSWLSTPVLAFGLQGIAASRTDAAMEVEAIVERTIEDIAKSGFDQRRVDAMVFRETLQQRHKDSSYGVNIVIGLTAMSLVKSHHSTLGYLNSVPILKRIAADPKNELLPMLTDAFINNKHKVLLQVEPDSGFLDKINAPVAAREKVLSAAVTEESAKELSEKTAAWLSRVRAVQDASCLPALKVSDIPLNGFVEPVPREVGDGLFHLSYPTNGLVYVHGLIPVTPEQARILQEVQPNGTANADATVNKQVLSLATLHNLFGRTGAGDMDFKEVSIAVDQTMSGFGVSPVICNVTESADVFTVAGSFGFYTTTEKIEEAMKLVTKIFGEARTSDITERVDVILSGRASSMSQSIAQRGNAVAGLRASSYLNGALMVKELLGGLSQVEHATSLLSLTKEEKDAAIGGIIGEYGAFCSSLKQRVGHALVWYTCEDKDEPTVTAAMKKFKGAFEGPECAPLQLQFKGCGAPLAESINLEIPLSLDTSFAAASAPHCHTFASETMQKLRLGARVLSSEYLHKRVREEGGAYGSSCTANSVGAANGVSMTSYRDPTPAKTLTAFKEASAWLLDPSNLNDERVEQAKLNLFAVVDAPNSPDSFGGDYFLSKTSADVLQRNRERLLAMTAEQIREGAPLFDITSGPHCTVCLVPKKQA